jgi:hypothetical protein
LKIWTSFIAFGIRAREMPSEPSQCPGRRHRLAGKVSTKACWQRLACTKHEGAPTVGRRSAPQVEIPFPLLVAEARGRVEVVRGMQHPGGRRPRRPSFIVRDNAAHQGREGRHDPLPVALEQRQQAVSPGPVCPTPTATSWRGSRHPIWQLSHPGGLATPRWPRPPGAHPADSQLIGAAAQVTKSGKARNS